MEIIDHRDVIFASGAFTSLCSGGLRLQPGGRNDTCEGGCFEKCPKDPFFFPSRKIFHLSAGLDGNLLKSTAQSSH